MRFPFPIPTFPKLVKIAFGAGAVAGVAGTFAANGLVRVARLAHLRHQTRKSDKP